MSNPTLTLEQTNEAYALYCTGLTLREVAQRYNMTGPGLGNVFRRHHLPTRSLHEAGVLQRARRRAATGPTARQREVLGHRAAGESYATIAAALGVRKATVWKTAKRGRAA